MAEQEANKPPEPRGGLAWVDPPAWAPSVEIGHEVRGGQAPPERTVAIGHMAHAGSNAVAIGTMALAHDDMIAIGSAGSSSLTVRADGSVEVTDKSGTSRNVLTVGPKSVEALAKIIDVSADGKVSFGEPLDDAAVVGTAARSASDGVALETLVVALANEVVKLRWELERVKSRVT